MLGFCEVVTDEIEWMNIDFYWMAEIPLSPQQKRTGTLPRNVREYLHNWLLTHRDYPYMSNQDRKQIAETFNITEKQIRVYLANGRKRILNRSGVAPGYRPPLAKLLNKSIPIGRWNGSLHNPSTHTDS